MYKNFNFRFKNCDNSFYIYIAHCAKSAEQNVNFRLKVAITHFFFKYLYTAFLGKAEQKKLFSLISILDLKIEFFHVEF